MNSKNEDRSPRYASAADLKSAARGDWTNILVDVGIPRKSLDGKGHSCPMCGGEDRFAAFDDVADRGAVHCRHCFTSGTTPRPSDGIATLQWIMEYDFVTAVRWLEEWLETSGRSIKRTGPQKITRSVPIEKKSALKLPLNSKSLDLAALVKSVHESTSDEMWERFSNKLGLPVLCLKKMGVGWSVKRNAMIWPMQNSKGDVVGVRMRSLTTNKKWSLKGGKSGIFVPIDLPEHLERLFIVEGATDAAALVSLRLPVFGRASASGSRKTEVNKIRGMKVQECVVVADSDQAGISSADQLVKRLVRHCQRVRRLVPPDGFKDAREWIQSGALASDVLAAAAKAPSLKLKLRSEVKS
ncbi:primase-helicase zinc-binding domain-containing protein [Rhodopirellula europaea]|nr:primase-helicase zinc-binding domain-containing protein [Rhodopirellula europaea]